MHKLTIVFALLMVFVSVPADTYAQAKEKKSKTKIKNSKVGKEYTSETGLIYKHFIKNESPVATLGDMITLELYYTNTKDSVIFDSRVTGQPMLMSLSAPEYKGDILEGFAMMSKGDSAMFKVDAENFFTKTVKIDLPDFIEKGEKLNFYVILHKIQSVEEMQKEHELNLEASRIHEYTNLKEFLATNNIVDSPTESGLFYIEKVKGEGIQVEKGQTVQVHYVGRLLDGTLFDTSVEEVAISEGKHNPQRPYTPFEFVLGEGMVIKGWDEGIAYM
nr:FKBP-type peptidyl-prolyl cis-trans isomerase [Bacteroidota bacterium]